MKKKFQFIFKAFNIFSKDVFFVRDYNFPYVSGNISIFLIIIISNQAIFFHEKLRIKYYLTNLVSMIPLTSYIGLSKNSLICSTFHKRILMLIWKKYLCILSFIILIILLYTKNYSTNNKNIQMKWMEKTMSSKTDANQRMGTCKKLKCFTIKNLVLTKNKLHC